MRPTPNVTRLAVARRDRYVRDRCRAEELSKSRDNDIGSFCRYIQDVMCRLLGLDAPTPRVPRQWRMPMRSIRARAVAIATAITVIGTIGVAAGAGASTPATTTLSPSSTGDTSSVSWTGGPYTGAVLAPESCTPTTCDSHAVTLSIPTTYWDNHTGGVKIGIGWTSGSDDYDLY